MLNEFLLSIPSLSFSRWWRYIEVIISIVSLIGSSLSGALPTNDISIKFEMHWNFVMFSFITCSVDHNEMLHTSRQCSNCRDVCKISLCSVEHILNQSTPNFDRNTVSGTGACRHPNNSFEHDTKITWNEIFFAHFKQPFWKTLTLSNTLTSGVL